MSKYGLGFGGKVALPTAKTPINSELYKNKISNFMNRTNSINTFRNFNKKISPTSGLYFFVNGGNDEARLLACLKI